MIARALTWLEQLRNGKPPAAPDAIDVNLAGSHHEFVRFVDAAMPDADPRITDALKHHVKTINGDFTW